MNKQTITLIACMVFGIGILYSLFALSPYAAEIPRQPFDRDFNTRILLSRLKTIDLNVNSFYLSGTANNTIYLGNWTGPFHLVQIKIPDLDTTHIKLKVTNITLTEDYRNFRLKVDSPYFYLAHGIMPGIFKGEIKQRTADKFLPIGVPYFVDATPVSSTLFALKSMNSESNENELATLNTHYPYFQFKPDALQKQVDGFFCVEGMLHFDKTLNNLIYVYAYRNEFIVMDTMLNVVNRHHTIDTFSTAPIKVANVKSKNYRTLASPPVRVNLQTCVSDNRLFIQSPFLARNEDKLKFQTNSEIDVYEITSGKYLYSFYLDLFEGRSPSSFQVFGQYLAAIYDHYLVLYHLNLPVGALTK